MEQAYQLAREQAMATRTVAPCQALPDVSLPYRRDARGEAILILSQTDGPYVPDRELFWPRTQCLYAYAQAYGSSTCMAIFAGTARRQECLREVQEAPLDRYQTLKAGPRASIEAIGKKTFFSTTSQKPLPYLIFYPDKPVRGILIYLHGAGGGLEQGALDGSYEDSFKRLRDLLRNELSYLYVTPSLSNFSAGGGQDVRDLAQELHVAYPDAPIYLAGASAGGRTLFHALQAASPPFAGAIALCPAVDPAMQIGALGTAPDEQKPPLWIIQGEQDPFVSAREVDALVQRLTDANARLTYEKIPGDHDAPLERVDWKNALDFLSAQPSP